MAFTNPADSISFPSDAGSGQIRMVVGADTPDELRLYGIAVAMLFYVTDFESGLESGYFFIGLTNRLDIGDDEAVVYGGVKYPVLGNPDSAGSSDVKTHMQFSWDFTGTGATGKAFTVFKDRYIQINDSVPQVNSRALAHFWNNDTFYPSGSRQIHQPGSEILIDGRSAPRGLVQRSAGTANPWATATTAETNIFTLLSATYPANRAFKYVFRAQINGSAIMSFAPRLRKGDGGTGLTGALLLDNGAVHVPVAGTDRYFKWEGEFKTGAAVTTDLVFTSLTSTGTLQFRGFGTGSIMAEVWDIGLADDFPAVLTLT